MTKKSQKRRRDGTWKKGVSGNPNGRPKGSRSAATRIAQAVLSGDAEMLAAKAVELALAGDVSALRLCLARLVPPVRGELLELPDDFPGLEEGGVRGAVAALLRAVAAGQVSTRGARDLAALLDVYGNAERLEELEQLLAELEGAR